MKSLEFEPNSTHLFWSVKEPVLLDKEIFPQHSNVFSYFCVREKFRGGQFETNGYAPVASLYLNTKILVCHEVWTCEMRLIHTHYISLTIEPKHWRRVYMKLWYIKAHYKNLPNSLL